MDARSNGGLYEAFLSGAHSSVSVRLSFSQLSSSIVGSVAPRSLPGGIGKSAAVVCSALFVLSSDERRRAMPTNAR